MNEGDLSRIVGNTRGMPETAVRASFPASPCLALSREDIEALPLSEDTKTRILMGYQGGYTSRSEEDMAVVDALVWANLTDEQITRIFEQHPIGEKAREKGKSFQKYMETTIRAAREHVTDRADVNSDLHSVRHEDVGTQKAGTQKKEPLPLRIISVEELLNTKYPRVPAVIGGGILDEQGALMIDGESGVGKSLLRTELAVHLCLGMEFCGLEIPHARKVLIAQFENAPYREQYRLKKILQGLGVQQGKLYGRLFFHDRTQRFDLKLKGDQKRALELVKAAEVDVIVWDCLSNLHQANENDNIAMRAVLDTLTWIAASTNTSNILVHHFGKPQETLGVEHRSRGASSIRDWTDTKVALVRKPHETKELRLLHFVKVRNGPHRPAILLERDEHFLHNIVPDETMCPPEKIAEILAEMGGTADSQNVLAKRVAENLSCSHRTAGQGIKVAVGQGFIRELLGAGNRAKRYVKP